MTGRPWARRTLATFAGLLFALALAEGFLAVYAGRHGVAPPRREAGFTVLCVGNSYTKGDGAVAGYSYGEILERLLRERRPGLDARVINGGVSLGTTTLLLERLPAQLREFHPDVVAVMAGDPNFVFTYGFSRFLERRGGESGLARAWHRAEDLLFGLRVFRWARFLAGGFYGPSYRSYNALQWLAFLEDVSYNALWFDKERGELAYSSLSAYFDAHPDDKYVAAALVQLSAVLRNDRWDYWLGQFERLAPKDFFFLAYEHTEHGLRDPNLPGKRRAALEKALARLRRNYPGDRRYHELANSQLFGHAQVKPYLPAGLTPRGRCEWIEGVLPLNALNVRHYQTLASCWLDLGEEVRAAEAMIRAAERNPYSEHNAVETLLLMKYRSRNEKVIARIGAFVSDFFAKYPELRYQGYVRSSPERSEWVRSDYREISSLVRDAGIPLVIQSYPPLRDGFERVIDRLIPELARENHAVFSDVNGELRKRFTSPGEKESYYSVEFGPADHHLNAKGNTVVAELLYRTLDENHLLPGEPAR